MCLLRKGLSGDSEECDGSDDDLSQAGGRQVWGSVAVRGRHATDVQQCLALQPSLVSHLQELHKGQVLFEHLVGSDCFSQLIGSI